MAKCGKVQYPNEAAAKVALVGARAARALRKATRRREERAYPCPACRAWHLTSRGPRAVS